jgi:hypothetical protein
LSDPHAIQGRLGKPDHALRPGFHDRWSRRASCALGLFVCSSDVHIATGDALGPMVATYTSLLLKPGCGHAEELTVEAGTPRLQDHSSGS